jgi:ligand-binding sensor domain-containing protein
MPAEPGARAGRQVWLGGNVGMSLYDPATSTVIRSYRADDKTPGKLSHSIVYSMYQDDGKGPLWLGTSNGLNRLDTPDSPFQASTSAIPPATTSTPLRPAPAACCGWPPATA